MVLVGSTPITEIAYYLPEQLEKMHRWVPEGHTVYEQTSTVMDNRIFKAPTVSEAELRSALEEGTTVWLVERDPAPVIMRVETAFASKVGAAGRRAAQWRYGTISITQYVSAGR